jgi:hypothetical protein
MGSLASSVLALKAAKDTVNGVHIPLSVLITPRGGSPNI